MLALKVVEGTGAGLIGRRGFYLAVGRHMLSCHLNGYGQGSQVAVRIGATWYGWWSDGGWAAKPQQPLKVTSRLVRRSTTGHREAVASESDPA